MLNADSPVALRDAIKCAFIDVLEKISERTLGAAPVATGEPPILDANKPAYNAVAEP